MRENFGALINVRLESKRYPKKAKQKITNITLIEILIKRLLLVENKKNIVICTYKSQLNVYFKLIAKKYGIKIYYGSKDNLLVRMISCAEKYNFKNIFRITGDNPFIDYENYLKLKYTMMKKKDLEYVYSNIPARGMRCELISLKGLKKTLNKSINKEKIDYLSYYFFRDNFLKKKIFQSKLRKKNITFSIDYKKNFLEIKKFILNNKISILEKSEQIYKLAIKNKLLKKNLKIISAQKINLKTKKYDCRIIGDKPNKIIKSYF